MEATVQIMATNLETSAEGRQDRLREESRDSFVRSYGFQPRNQRV